MSVNYGTGMTPAEEDALLGDPSELPEYEDTLPTANNMNLKNKANETCGIPG